MIPSSYTAQIEYMVVSFDEETKNARLSLRQSEILKELAAEEAEAVTALPGAACVGLAATLTLLRSRKPRLTAGSPRFTLSTWAAVSCGSLASYRSQVPKFHPEYGRYMLESTPGAPYGATLKDLLTVETNMRLR